MMPLLFVDIVDALSLGAPDDLCIVLDQISLNILNSRGAFSILVKCSVRSSTHCSISNVLHTTHCTWIHLYYFFVIVIQYNTKSLYCTILKSYKNTTRRSYCYGRSLLDNNHHNQNISTSFEYKSSS